MSATDFVAAEGTTGPLEGGPASGVGRSLSFNFSWTLAGHVTYAACQWGVVGALAKYGTPEMVGQFALGLAITTPVILFFNLQLSSVQVTDTRQEYTFQEYLTLRLATTAMAIATVVAIAVLSGYPAATLTVIVAIGLAKATDAISDVYSGHLQQHERMRRVGIALMINGGLTLAGVTAVLVMNGGVVEAMWASWLASIATLIFYYRYAPPSAAFAGLKNWRRLSGRRQRQLLKLSLPLGLAALAVALYMNAPRYFVEHYAGERGLGYFAAVWCFMGAGTTIMGALGQSAAPKLSRYWLEGRTREFRRLLGGLVAIALVLGVAGVIFAILWGGRILSVLYQPEYAVHSRLLVWVMAVSVLAYVSSALGYAATATREFGRLTLPFGLVAIVSAFACWVLVPRYELLGAVWAAGITFLAACAVSLGVLLVLGAGAARRKPASPLADYDRSPVLQTRAF